MLTDMTPIPILGFIRQILSPHVFHVNACIINRSFKTWDSCIVESTMLTSLAPPTNWEFKSPRPYLKLFWEFIWMYSTTVEEYERFTCNEQWLEAWDKSHIIYNLCYPFNPDLRCGLFFPAFLFENKLNITERGAAEVKIERVTEVIGSSQL